MRKLTLRLEALAVESFDTALQERWPGTVAGNEYTIGCESGGCIPSGNGTCGRCCTCPENCQYSYGGSCPPQYTCDGCPVTTGPGETLDYEATCIPGVC
jgi:hypothetical protein